MTLMQPGWARRKTARGSAIARSWWVLLLIVLGLVAIGLALGA